MLTRKLRFIMNVDTVLFGLILPSNRNTIVLRLSSREEEGVSRMAKSEQTKTWKIVRGNIRCSVRVNGIQANAQ